MASLILIAYFFVLGVLAALGLYRLSLALFAFAADARARRGRAVARPGLATLGPNAPCVLVQVPLYNEAFVAERVIEAVARLRYPSGRIEIQVLDDSSDRTTGIVTRKVEELAGRGIAIRVLRREDRRGFKAGALSQGLASTNAELVAIFDADFVPETDFLERTVPVLLADPRLALVQARWGHLNRTVSWLTRAEAVFLDGHFAIEQRARAARGRFFNFNGTAGVWRVRAIEDAGGWAEDIITEDLELSCRAQLRGWRFQYVDDVVTPAELPESWSAFRSQQARWVRGSIETARRHLPAIWRAKQVPITLRLDAAVHLLNNVAYLFMAMLGILLPLVVIMRGALGWRLPGGLALASVLDLATLGFGTCAMIAFYSAASIRLGSLPPVRVIEILFALAVGVGVSIQNARAVIAGLASSGAEFVRTPKRGDAPRGEALALYRAKQSRTSAHVELILAAYHLAAVAAAVHWSLFGSIPFLLFYVVGFAVAGAGVLLENRRLRTAPDAEALSLDTPG